MHTYFSPAKINLYLKVVAKRLDGFHELSTLMQTISLGDFLHIELADTDSLTCSNSMVPIDSSNLILKALNLFKNKTGLKFCFKVHLEKNIPMQAGLGGGSSNAATTLWACNQLTQSNISITQLFDWSAEIGSDIPFFFSQGTAHCTGRGEFVKILPNLDKKQVWIVKPKISLSTPLVFQNFKMDENTINDNEEWGINDLEKVAFKLEPSLLELKNRLIQAGFETIMMTGTGSSFYCLGDSSIEKDHELFTYSAHFINRYPDHWYSLAP
ncbi:MAG: 4-(cytidine 5'-diphospho)-2-C-methyl-D-erythritol kinase [Parachlamydiaceae bacterium]|nr:4-(cytidine 5'-diphospho)-2-C-methyl-D-erythritol kinase [Parachlamydiaceae bacterium]